MTQQSMDSLLAMAGQYSPTLGSMMQMLAPMIRAQTGVDIRTLANPLMPSSNMRRFNAMDALMMNDYTTPFRHGIYGPFQRACGRGHPQPRLLPASPGKPTGGSSSWS